ncbi:Uncharacterized protein Adt_33463 [Abeliophyllum distichum]|uniref:Uncharacterized protein n=1 Tax=Abeliophyllum distichum TaxID=126358 RepID=A0ABD1QWA6_9LAMI
MMGEVWDHCQETPYINQFIHIMMKEMGLPRSFEEDDDDDNLSFFHEIRSTPVRRGVVRPKLDKYTRQGDSFISKRKISLAVEVGKELLLARNFMEFLIIDRRSTYNGMLGHPALKQLMAVTSIHHFTMIFLTPALVATVKKNQELALECYLNTLKNEAM